MEAPFLKETNQLELRRKKKKYKKYDEKIKKISNLIFIKQCAKEITNAAKWNHCHVSQQPLEKPIVADLLGL